MHGNLTLSGPVYWLLVAFMYAVGGLALFVAVDPLRARRAPSFERRPGRRFAWSVPQALYFLLFVLVNVPGIATPALGALFVGATPVAFGLQVAYLLRVVYPAPGPGAEERMARELEAGTDGEA